MTALPIDPLLPDIWHTLAEHRALVLQAPPGAGKTTRVPPALLDAPWLAGRRIIMLEPRRLAARAAARYMARERDEEVGETVGYRVRNETCVGRTTRIEVVTEGVLTRLLQADPALSDYGLVVFDEFHERSLHADLALALTLDSRQALRDDLRVLVMSATLDGAAVARLLGDAPVLTSEGRSFPVITRYAPPPREVRIEQHVAGLVLRVLREERGSVLVFLPGAGEIRRVQALLEGRFDPGVRLVPLYGDLPPAMQDEAIAPAAPGMRKVVLATSIAETSLTIEGVRVVIDAGLARLPRFDPVSGMTRLVTVRVSRAAADQRRGRAGRLEAGVCYRAWSEAEDARLAPQTRPEILDADLAPLALELAGWGATDPASLAWLDPPPAAHYAQAVDLLQQLGALDAARRITAHGRAMLALGTHPRLAHMMLRGRELGAGGLACDIAALLAERDILRGAANAGVDLRLRLERLQSGDHDTRLHAVRENARVLRRELGVRDERADVERAGELLALAYPDRIAQRRPGTAPRYLLANGRGAFLATPDRLMNAPYLAIAELDGDPREARVFLAAPLSPAELGEAAGERLTTEEIVQWDQATQAVIARRRLRYGALVLEDRPLAEPDPDAVGRALLEGLRALGVAGLPWTPALRNFQARVMFLRRLEGERWPALDDATLTVTLDEWLGPFLGGRTRLAQIDAALLGQALEARLDWSLRRSLDELAPTHLVVPSGSRIPLDYTQGEIPVLAVRLQEMFGLADTPRIAGGRVPVLLHLLSPAHRPVQVTSDLAGFWRTSYHDVKKDLKGRYPKHHWPDDPLAAEPTARTKLKRR